MNHAALKLILAGYCVSGSDPYEVVFTYNRYHNGKKEALRQVIREELRAV